MELIRDLEQTFQNINTTLNSNAKVESAGSIYTNDLQRIDRLFKFKKEKYEKGLNECRDELLKKNIQKRDEELQQVNEFIQSSQQKNLIQLKSLHKSIKQNYTALAKGLASVYESILFRSKLANPLKLAQLVKYEKLMQTSEKVCFAKANDRLDLDFYNDDFYSFHLLPSNLIFLCSCITTDRYSCVNTINMGVLNKSGDLVHFKVLNKQLEFDFKVNAANIFAFFNSDLTIQIFNFKLELVHSLGFDPIYYRFTLNNYEIVLSEFFDIHEDFKIVCYNYKTAKLEKKEICLHINELNQHLDPHLNINFIEDCTHLVGLSDEFLFISVLGFSLNDSFKMFSFVFLLNRNEENSLYKYFIGQSSGEWFIYGTEICKRTFENYGNFATIQFNDIHSASDETVVKYVNEANGKKFKQFYSTSNYKYIYSKKVVNATLTLEFSQY